jgi:hypothetical protein
VQKLHWLRLSSAWNGVIVERAWSGDDFGWQ